MRQRCRDAWDLRLGKPLATLVDDTNARLLKGYVDAFMVFHDLFHQTLRRPRPR
jgi:hypothetical protein